MLLQFELLSLLLVGITLSAQALPLPSHWSRLERRDGATICPGVVLRTAHRKVCLKNNAMSKSYRFQGENLVSDKLPKAPAPEDQCDHTFEIQLFTKLFKAGAKEVRRTERQLCDQLFPPEPNSINDRRTQLPRVTESDTNLFFMPGPVNRAKSVILDDDRNFAESTPEVLKNRRAAARVLKDHKLDLAATVKGVFQVLAETPAEAASQAAARNPFTQKFAEDWTAQFKTDIQKFINDNENLFLPSQVPDCPKGTKRKRPVKDAPLPPSDERLSKHLRPNSGWKWKGKPARRAETGEEENACVPDDAAETLTEATVGQTSSHSPTASDSSTRLLSSVSGARPSTSTSLFHSAGSLSARPTGLATASSALRVGSVTRSGEPLDSKSSALPLGAHSTSLSSPTSRPYAKVAAGQPSATAQSSKPTAVAVQPALAPKPTRIASPPARVTPNAVAPLSPQKAPTAGKVPPLARPLRALPLKAKPAVRL